MFGFQEIATLWAYKCFGAAISLNRRERILRFTEEALELAQCQGLSEADVTALLAHVYSRPTGIPVQEVGGVMVTLAVLCSAQGMDVEDCAKAELSRCWDKIDAIREKQKTKPMRGTP